MLQRVTEQLWWFGRRSGAGLWVCVAFCASLVLAVFVLATMGTGERGTSIALQLTGRFSLLLFWPAYAGGAMATLFGPRFGVLAKHGREFGLAYASAQLVHVGLVAHIVSVSRPLTLDSIMPFFAVGVLWTYLLALSSVERVCNLFAPGFWRVLRNIGLEYLALVFFVDFVMQPIGHHFRHLLAYLPFSVLIILGPILRMAAMVRRSGLFRSLPRTLPVHLQQSPRPGLRG
jgi:hypothetical protein